MKFYAQAELSADFPDDAVEKDGEFVVFPGRNVAEAIADALRRAGYEVGPPEHMHEHGWDLNVYVGGRRIWLEIQGGYGEFVLQVEAMVGFFQRIFRVDLTYYEEFLTKLNDGLRADSRFGPVKWLPLANHRPTGGPPSDDPLKVREA